jgi:hypothetical protein
MNPRLLPLPLLLAASLAGQDSATPPHIQHSSWLVAVLPPSVLQATDTTLLRLADSCRAHLLDGLRFAGVTAEPERTDVRHRSTAQYALLSIISRDSGAVRADFFLAGRRTSLRKRFTWRVVPPDSLPAVADSVARLFASILKARR